jgi:hypothetical protein
MMRGLVRATYAETVSRRDRAGPNGGAVVLTARGARVDGRHKHLAECSGTPGQTAGTAVTLSAHRR